MTPERRLGTLYPEALLKHVSILLAVPGMFLVALSGCASRNCCCPCPSSGRPTSAVVPDTPSSDVHQAAARKAWTDEIMASEKWLAGCLYAAAQETDGAAREQKRAKCMEQYGARATANDEAYERSKGTPVPPPIAPDPQSKRRHDAEVDKYIQRLKDPDAGVAFTATYKLKDLKDLRAVPPLLETLKGHKDYYTRLGAAVALGEMKACDAVPALIEAMDDKADLVRTGAAEALEIITDHEVRSAVGASRSERSAIEEEWKIWWRENEASVRQRLGQAR